VEQYTFNLFNSKKYYCCIDHVRYRVNPCHSLLASRR
jgi:hypothetical protein